MDRWYDAEDGGVWLSFPSSERNKINEDTNLILKKKHDSNEFTEYDVSYKVLSISSNAPKFVKTDSKYWGSIPIMLPPPGWGDVGNWDTGMLHPTGLPLPNRMNIDVIAEYFDSTALKGLNNFKGAQIRISQSPGVPSSYNSVTNELTNVTKWYNVANINYIGSPGQTYFDENGVEQEVEGLPVRIARIALETAFGSDALFCESDSVLQPTGSDGGSYISANSNISMSRGLSIEARTTEEKDKAQFEGRFFVKILRDANVEANIVQSQATQSEDWQVLQSKDIKYVCAAHPGTQDWNHSYYIAPHVDWTTNTPGTESLLVSSLSKYVKMTSATYVDAAGALQDGPNLGGKRWPFGPSNHTDGTYSTPGYWQTKNKDFLDGNNDFKDSQNTVSEWPSYGPHSLSWEPAHHWAIAGDYGNATNSTGTYSFLTNASTLTQRGILDLSGGCSTGGGANGQITGLCADNPIQLSWLNTSVTSAITPGTDPRGYRGVANPYMVPAVWGDQSDFIVSAATCDPGALWPRGCQPVFSTGTMEKLSQHWYNLWRGRNIAGSEWPLGSFHPDRWFFDKAGAAEGGSGNGIWNDGMQSYMHVSYWGLGKAGGYNRESNTALAAKHQPTELMFAEAMGTVGTTFRFKQDPDQTVYTVTNVQVEGAVWNYENPVGSWGYIDDGVATGGGGVFGKMLPPFGSAVKGSGLAGGTAFMSDVVMAKHTPNSERARLTGGAPSNRRVRYTLTLDKVIGAEGPNSFHPITNHVDAEGKANVKRGRQKYFTSLNHGITSDFGATPGSEEYYNLNSYWNANDNAGGGKNKQPSYTDKGYNTKFAEEITAGSKTAQNYYGDDGGTSPPNPGGYIGLHERGINETTIEVISRYSGKDREFPMSNNPAIWETEPKEDVGLDIYYAASPTFPVQLKRNRWSAESVGSDGNSQADEVDGFGANWYDFSGRGEDIIKVGSWVRVAGYQEMKVCDVKDDLIFLDRIVQLDDGTAQDLPLGTPIRIEWYGEGAYYGAARDTEWVDMIIHEYMGEQVYRIGESGALQSGSHKVKHGLGYYNCYSFGTGVESNRVRDDYNAVTLGKGIKASMPLAEQYKEERKGSGLIFSGIYNSTSGINRTNQFIQAEPITKDLNPVNGSIQKLFARDTDLVTFCENKIFKILAKKDALFNADGNTNVTSNSAVLGQAIPFSGEYGMSRNPESFASESYRVYFTDKDRGAVLRLSKDGLTPISDQGMKDWFRDNLRFATSLIGSHDDREDQYNLTLETADQDGVEKAYTISYTEKARGWVSFKSFIQQGGISHKNIYYTFPSNKYNDIRILDPWGVVYGGKNGAEAHQHNLDIRLERVTTTTLSGGLNMQVNDGIGVILEGMNVSGNGIPIDTRVGSVVCASGFCNVTLTTADGDRNDSLWVSNSTAIKFTTARNRFYGKDNYSMVKVLFNGAQGSVKRFKTLNYEGTQTRVVGEEKNKITYYENINYGGTEKDLIGRKSDDYYDNYTKKGWWVHNISTDMQEGAIKEFVDKENKWFSYIRGTAGTLVGGDSLDTAEFSIQGLGFSGSKLPTVYGCMDEAASEYNEEATVDDGSCYTEEGGGCTDPTAYNYNINATHDDESCIPIIYGCTNAYAQNYNHENPANTEDGSCIPFIYGCMDPEAFNYVTPTGDPQVDINTTCEATDGEDDVNPCCQSVVEGCTDGAANNYDALANTDDGNCTYTAYGCTDDTMFNYDPLASTDDGSCYAIVLGCTDPQAINYDYAANTDDGSCYIYTVLGCTDDAFANYNPQANTDDGSCTSEGIGCMLRTYANFDPNANIPCTTDCYTGTGAVVGNNCCCEPCIYGCTQPQGSINYDPEATCDDESCIPIRVGCTDPSANNYDAPANTDDGSCTYDDGNDDEVLDLCKMVNTMIPYVKNQKEIDLVDPDDASQYVTPIVGYANFCMDWKYLSIKNNYTQATTSSPLLAQSIVLSFTADWNDPSRETHILEKWAQFFNSSPLFQGPIFNNIIITVDMLQTALEKGCCDNKVSEQLPLQQFKDNNNKYE